MLTYIYIFCLCEAYAAQVNKVECILCYQCVYVYIVVYTCTFQCLRPCLDRSGAEGLAIHFLLEWVFTTPSDECSSFTPTLQALFMSAVRGLCE